MFESCRAHCAMRWTRLASVLVLAFLAVVATAEPAEAPSYGLVQSTRPSRFHGVTVWDGRSRLLIFESGGWRDATPAGLLGGIHSVVFINRVRGWLIASDCARADGALFRTLDGGKSWRRMPRRWWRNCSAGATFHLDFADARHGWIAAVDPHASEGSLLYRTTNGGTRWSRSWRDRGHSSDGPVRFSSAKLGWRASTWMGWPYPGALLRSRDGGRSWAPDPELPANRRYATPELVGDRVVTAGAKAGRIVVYERAGHWRRVSAVNVARPVTDLVVSAPSPSVRWLASGPRARLSTLLVSVDGGRTWSRRSLPRGTLTVSASSASRAWATANGSLLRTTDGGRTWRSVRFTSGRRR
jgi:photosystem II stability/assembly factor-like uncharacterized protein